MKVAIYARVSTDNQELENQIAVLKDYVAKNGWDLYKVYSDIISGKETSRYDYDNLFKEAHQRLFDGVVFFSLTRFSRAGALHTLQKLHELDILNIFYASYTEPYINSVGLFKEAIIAIHASLAAIERDRLSRQTKAGLKCQCGHTRLHHADDGSCLKCDCPKFRGTGHRGKDKGPRNRAGYYLKKRGV